MGLDLRCPAAGLQDIPGQGGQSSLSAAGQIELTIPRGLVRRHAQRRECESGEGLRHLERNILAGEARFGRDKFRYFVVLAI